MEHKSEGASCYSLFREWVDVQETEGLVSSSGMYTPAVVTWLMIYQRLNGGLSLGAAVDEFASGALSDLAGNCKRTREGRISNHTGGYSQARQALSVELTASIADGLFQYLSEDRAIQDSAYGRPIYSVDGTVIELLRSRELAKKYPPERKGHYPCLRMVVCHNLESGLAVRPEFGPYWGKKQQSEIMLVRRMFERLPENGIFVGDRYYGIFSVVFCAKQARRDVIFRLSEQRAKKILNHAPAHGVDERVLWKVSHHDRAKNPEIPKDAEIAGRIICRNVQPNNSGKVIPLYLFTTLEDETPEKIIEMYGLRWHVETDLRTLKQTVSMQMLHVKSEDMAGKELILGICAYNLVIAVRIIAANQMDVSPRALSFKRTLDIIECYAPKIISATSDQRNLLMERFSRAMAACKHPNRSTQRREPRAVVRNRRAKFPTLKGSRASAKRRLMAKN